MTRFAARMSAVSLVSLSLLVSVAITYSPVFARSGVSTANQIAQSAAPETQLPGQWSATTPQGTTVIHIVLNADPTKNPDGSLIFTGKIWSTGGGQRSEEPLEIAKFDGGKINIKWAFGGGTLTLNGTMLTGFITYGTIVLKDMKFRKP